MSSKPEQSRVIEDAHGLLLKQIEHHEQNIEFVDISEAGVEDELDDDELTQSEYNGSVKGVDNEDLADKKHSTFMSNLRQWVVILFVYLSVCVPLIIYISTRKTEVNTFEYEFNSLSDQAVFGFQDKLTALFYSIDALSVASTSHALAAKEEWPFVTLLDFDLRGASVLALSQTILISLNPLVTNEQRPAWENYTQENVGWFKAASDRTQNNLQEEDTSRFLQDSALSNSSTTTEEKTIVDRSDGYSKEIYHFDGDVGDGVVESEHELYTPSWQSWPLSSILINYNWLTHQTEKGAIQKTLDTEQSVISELEDLTLYGDTVRISLENEYSYYLSLHFGKNVTYGYEPACTMNYPVFDTFQEDRKVAATFSSTIFWETFFVGLLPPNSPALIAVMENTCDNVFTYSIEGEYAIFLGMEDLHDEDYDYLALEYNLSFDLSTTSVASLNLDYCPYTLTLYPSDQMQQENLTAAPIVYAFVAFGLFLFTGFMSMAYDSLTQRRLRRILQTEEKARFVVSQIFPQAVQDRLFGNKSEKRQTVIFHPKHQLKSFLEGIGDGPDEKIGGEDASRALSFDGDIFDLKPIADLFPFCTVMFADISGFTAWSSERQPEEVFTLLENIFQTFDKLARRRCVFKVETIGDSYVAVTGLPDPQPDHAVRMARFARDCLSKVNELTKALESTLGPDTGELRLRFGLHSGQVTAGILRGQKSRFQLFGDTVNTASRIETSGVKNRIHLSETTAQLLISAGKEGWIVPREDKITAKGKGEMQTYWLVLRTADTKSVVSSNTSVSSHTNVSLDAWEGIHFKSEEFVNGANGWSEEPGIFALPQTTKTAKSSRLIDWLTDLIAFDVKRLVNSRRDDSGQAPDHVEDPAQVIVKKERVLDEFVEAFTMPKFDLNAVKHNNEVDSVELPPTVMNQLKNLVTELSERYKNNPFHNFEHASHVTMASVKLLKRIVRPEDIDYQRDNLDDIANDLHNCTFGITSDALIHFAVTFSALIHDVDHTGVPNYQFAKESPDLAEKYKDESILEQISVDVAWDIFMDSKYKELHAFVFASEHEVKRFRQYVVNLVMATDIFNKNMKDIRQQRWDKAFNTIEGMFSEDDRTSRTGTSQALSKMSGTSQALSKVSGTSASQAASQAEELNLKATIILEHIIQAADVSHTMQHWNVYKKWNERLFREMFSAFDSGRADKDPSEGWYKGELWFFDNYIIPLAQKLEECGVFGVSSDECLNYALENRKEWALKGKHVVKEMKDRYQKLKMLEVGGFSPDEIDSFTAQDLDYIIRRLIKKGRMYGTFKGQDEAGRKNAARAWFDALAIYVRCPASLSLVDASLIFPVYSGLVLFLKGGMILQDEELSFEQNLATKFVRDTAKRGDPVHYCRALAAKCDVDARCGRKEEALETFKKIEGIYVPEEHSELACSLYGTDQAAQLYSRQAYWHHTLGDIKKSLECCDYVIDKILPCMDEKNILNTFNVLLPVIRMRKAKEPRAMRDLFDKHVLQNLHKHNVTSTICGPILKPLLMLLNICAGDCENAHEIAEWLVTGNNALMDDFLDRFYSNLGWAPNTMIAELCLLVAKQTEDDASKRVHVEGGLRAARAANTQVKDPKTGKIVLPVAYEINQPVMTELSAMAEILNVELLEDDVLLGEETNDITGQSLKTAFGVVSLKA